MRCSITACPPGVYPITEETRQELCKIDHVKGVSLFCSRNYADGVYYGNNSFSGNLYGIDEYYFDVNGYSLDHGRSFLKEDFAKAKKVCMLDAAAASALFSGEDRSARPWRCRVTASRSSAL